jgi:alanine racemase
MKYRTWIEIDSSRLLHNLKEFFALIGEKARFMAVVKANAYGHGLAQVASLLGNFQIPISKSQLPNPNLWFGVDSLDEALTLRQAGITQPILTLGYVPLNRLKEAVEQGIRLTVYNRESIEALGKLQATSYKLQAAPSSLPPPQGNGAPGDIIPVHLKLETGTNRQGLLPKQALELCRLIKKYPNLHLEGVSSHFANIEDTTDHGYALAQLQRFNEAVQFLSDNLQITSYKLIRHTACSAATILFPETHFDMVRVGIGLYGLWPSKETFISARTNEAERAARADRYDTCYNSCSRHKAANITGIIPVSPQGSGAPGIIPGSQTLAPNLLPVLSFKTRIAQIKKIKAGESVGYGLSERVSRGTTLAILPVGYSDGYDRKLSSVGNVLIRGKRCKILGRVSMNMCITDITDVPKAKLEDEVTLIGESGGEKITAEELAQKIGTINYEVVARLNPLLPRVKV